MGEVRKCLRTEVGGLQRSGSEVGIDRGWRSSAARAWTLTPQLPLGRPRVLPLIPGWIMVEPPLWLRLVLLHKRGISTFRKFVRRVKRVSAMDTDLFNAESKTQSG